MRNILVTGGAGFIGSNFIHYLIEKEPNTSIINLDHLGYAGNLKNLTAIADDPRYKFIEGDIRNNDFLTSVFKNNRIDVVVHFAAESHVDRSIEGPREFIETNIIGTFNLLENARNAWAEDLEGKLFHHVSTDEVFGDLTSKAPAFTETTPYNPRSPYSGSKASSDHLVRVYFYTFGLPIKITNCTNNYGPYQYPEKLIPVIISNCLKGKRIPVYGDGMQIRDWLYVTDHCKAIWQVIKNGKTGETYNIGGNNQISNIEIVKTICRLMDELIPNSPNVPHENLIEFVKDRPGHDRRYAMNIGKISSEIGWRPSCIFKEGLANTVDWYINNQNWIAEIQEKKVHIDWIQKNYNER